MKKTIIPLVLGLGLILASGCEVGEEDDRDLEFVNASHQRVEVIPFTIEWTGFTLMPGEKKVIRDVTTLDFRLRPDATVQESTASTDRKVIIVDKLKAASR
ncbi:MAG TPA: hypothetical protein PKM67_01340 [Kiritimatiellia bacterium]|nr:hypothetical protein [Kiritimatiellia bacterium]HNR93613.1 hypothetical protein [Kiritimatiellia bacterium]HNS80086.1 hypothetical protein [Kiritimatiellia bacterium]HPA77886.1 hypothetical protein [Kiritimatiellia bacterium]HQQ03935.1 hypothetical protein [Kiritimatiellia bacterium]